MLISASVKPSSITPCTIPHWLRTTSFVWTHKGLNIAQDVISKHTAYGQGVIATAIVDKFISSKDWTSARHMRNGVQDMPERRLSTGAGSQRCLQSLHLPQISLDGRLVCCSSSRRQSKQDPAHSCLVSLADTEATLLLIRAKIVSAAGSMHASKADNAHRKPGAREVRSPTGHGRQTFPDD